MNSATKWETQIVLIGAGNAHLVFLKKWRMAPVAGVSVVLISPTDTIPYSAMIPGFLAGEYAASEISIDLVRLCRSANVRLLTQGQVVSIQPEKNTITLSHRPYELSYDLLSLNVGAMPSGAGIVSTASTFALRPIAQFLLALPTIDEKMHRAGKTNILAICGAGPSGCEIACALASRYESQNAEIHLFDVKSHPMAQFPRAAGRWFLERLKKQGIQFHPSAEVKIQGDALLSWGASQTMEADVVVLATSPEASALPKASGISLTKDGFVRVKATLQSLSHENIFAVGDCTAIEGRESLPKNGVYSVRMGEALFESVVAKLRNLPMPSYRPQKGYLAILNGGKGKGLLIRGPLVFSGSWPRRLKNKIDKSWVSGFEPSPMPTELLPPRCNGCGAKVPASVLKNSLDGLSKGEDQPTSATGWREDAAIEKSAGEDHVNLSTVDFLPSFIDDPFRFGKITAAHCLSDIYAMNGEPRSALVILILPWGKGRLQESLFKEVMSGVQSLCRKEGVMIRGGHTGEGELLSLGLSVSGVAKQSQLFLKSGLRPGDHLVLTKKIGMGTLLAGWMRGLVSAHAFEEGLAEMEKSNYLARDVFQQCGVGGATDVTGFGLVGHLSEMLQLSGVSAEIFPSKVPLLSSFNELSGSGIQSSLYPENLKFQNQCVGNAAHFPCLFDPQTSGGLLGAIPDRHWKLFQSKASSSGLFYSEVGSVDNSSLGKITISEI